MVALRLATLWIGLVAIAASAPARAEAGESEGEVGDARVAEAPSRRREDRGAASEAEGRKQASPRRVRANRARDEPPTLNPGGPSRSQAARSWRASLPAETESATPSPPSGPHPSIATDGVVATALEDPVAEAARRFDEAVSRSRRHDHEVDQIRDKLARARIATDLGYDAKGFLQPSSRMVDGQKVHALIGTKGVPVAYLDIPPGIPTAPLLGTKIGVRGTARYDESLGARLIKVHDLDPLESSW